MSLIPSTTWAASIAKDRTVPTMPSFADIKSQALKAKDSAADKFNQTKDRYQVRIHHEFGVSYGIL